MRDRETSVRKYRYCYLRCLFHIVFFWDIKELMEFVLYWKGDPFYLKVSDKYAFQHLAMAFLAVI